MLCFSTNNQDVDRQLEAFVAFTQIFFDIEIIAVYILGSYLDGSAVESSDIDIAIVHNGDEGRADAIRSFFAAYARTLFAREIDLYLFSLAQIEELNTDELLTREGIINTKIASELLWGVDARDRIKLPDFDAYLVRTIKTPFYFMKRVRGWPEGDGAPTGVLMYPDPDDEFFGYLSFTKASSDVASKPILSLVGWICTARIALESRQFVGKKSDVPTSYERYINDEWTSYVSETILLVRNILQYGLPRTESERRSLRHVCSLLLAFENDYVRRYRAYVQSYSPS